MSPGTLIIRADAGIAMGTGHVMRCLALAQAWQDEGGQCFFAMAETTAASEERIRAEKFEFATVTAPPGTAQDAAQLVELAAARGASWIVVDGYQFDVEYQRALKAAGLKLLMVDDTGHAGASAADLVLDQNAHASEKLYQHREPYTKLLLGSRYALLRREFRPWREWKREIAPIGHKVLVTFGGSDPNNATVRVIRALRLLTRDNLEATVVVGGSYPHGDDLEQEVHRAGSTIRLLGNVSNMPELMAEADMAISGAGSTCWEMCFLGLPAIIIDVAENQTPVARELDRRGIAIHVGSSQNATPKDIAAQLKSILASRERRTEMSERGRRLVDGLGAERVISSMGALGLHLRHFEPGDRELLWEWANDPEVRTSSFSSEAITRAQHEKWFSARLADPNAILYLALDLNNRPVGQVRFHVEGPRALVSISLADGCRGKGYGKMLLTLAVEELFRSSSATVIDAYVKPTNEASLRVFTQAGFSRQDGVIYKEQRVIHFTLEKNRVS